MTDQPKRRGPKPKGKPRRKVIGFGVSPEHHEWLLQLSNRSGWLAAKIEEDRSKTKIDSQIDSPKADQGRSDKGSGAQPHGDGSG